MTTIMPPTYTYDYNHASNIHWVYNLFHPSPWDTIYHLKVHVSNCKEGALEVTMTSILPWPENSRGWSWSASDPLVLISIIHVLTTYNYTLHMVLSNWSVCWLHVNTLTSQGHERLDLNAFHSMLNLWNLHGQFLWLKWDIYVGYWIMGDEIFAGRRWDMKLHLDSQIITCEERDAHEIVIMWPIKSN